MRGDLVALLHEASEGVEYSSATPSAGWNRTTTA